MSHQLSPSPRSTTTLPAPKPCGTVEGVEFWILPARSIDLRCVITATALEVHYGAGSDPASWIAAFLSHRADIERRAIAASARRDDVHVVLVTDSSGQLKAVVGRCG